MAAKKKSAKKVAKRPAPAAKAKPKARAGAKAATRPAKAGAGQGDVVYSDVLHELRGSLVARLIR